MSQEAHRAILLAAGVGKRLFPLTQTTPKCLIRFQRKTLLERTLSSLADCGMRDVAIVVGHLKEKVVAEADRIGRSLKMNVRPFENARTTGGNLSSVWTARSFLEGPALILDADLFFPTSLLKKLLESPHASAFLMDPSSKSYGEEQMLMIKEDCVRNISRRPQGEWDLLGEAVGISKFSAEDARKLRALVERAVNEDRQDEEIEQVYPELMRETEIGYVPVDGAFWREIDFPEDILSVENHLSEIKD